MERAWVYAFCYYPALLLYGQFYYESTIGFSLHHAAEQTKAFYTVTINKKPMTPSLRKRHRLIWLILPFLLAGFFIAACWCFPKTFPQDQLPQEYSTQSSKTDIEQTTLSIPE
ncbi:MAG: hypothetical protein ACI8P3_003933 [Saprospiraceae bacterium]|jgi:hypothetical protein